MKAMLLVLMLISFSSQAARLGRPNDNNLTQNLAKLRRNQIKSVNYELYFHLKKDEKKYLGKSTLRVLLNRVDEALSLDFKGEKIDSLVINGKAIKSYSQKVGFIEIPKNELAPEMTIEIEFKNSYSSESGGFLRSEDPEDKSVYVYTDLEPYYAHHIFPCFDQPDLKATYLVSVKAPVDWRVIQNEMPVDDKVEGGEHTVTFKKTPLLSTYLFFLGAGPFVEWKEMAGDVPLYLWARKSLAKHVDHERIFKTTKKGLKFFNTYFDYAYPFSKYGQIFVPEFAWGGMENPGAVTLNERNIFLGPVPQTRYEDRDNLILHEMAHMWFGDLVTMEWWNDLWLNESFASYLASIAQERAMDSEGTWSDFFDTKTWGYWQDQLVTTHPIETDVPDVRTAKGNFDGITYAKGASALKQLHYFVGEEGFRDGLRQYFKQYAFKNTQRKDFIGAIGAAAGKNLDTWTHKWLQTAGLNRVQFDYDCADGKMTKAQITQKESVSKTLSPHRAQIGLYEIDDDELESYGALDGLYSEAMTNIEGAKGHQCPDFVLPNQNDQDYALFSLDKKSLEKAPMALTALPDTLSKTMVWSMLAQMVRDQELKAMSYLQMAMVALEKEKDDMLLGNLLGRHSTIRQQYLLYLTSDERASMAANFEAMLWKRVEKAKPKSSLQMIFFDFYVSVVQTPGGLSRMSEMLTKNKPPKGITLDQDRRWQIISALSSQGHSEALKLIEAESKKDASTMGARMAYAARAALPVREQKEIYWKEFFTKKDLPYSTFKEAARKIHHPDFAQASEPFVQEYFSQVSSMNWKAHDDVVDIYFEELFPIELCNARLLQLSEQKLKAARKLTPLARRSWLEAQDELNRCVKVRAQGQSSVPKLK